MNIPPNENKSKKKNKKPNNVKLDKAIAIIKNIPNIFTARFFTVSLSEKYLLFKSKSNKPNIFIISSHKANELV